MCRWKHGLPGGRSVRLVHRQALGLKRAANRARHLGGAAEHRRRLRLVQREHFSACFFTATSTWPGLTWPMSMNASVCSSSWTTVAGISFATILQKTQLLTLSSRCLVTGAGYFEKGPVFEAQRAQLPAPDAAAIERGELRRELQPERRPVPEYDRPLVFSAFRTKAHSPRGALLPLALRSILPSGVQNLMRVMALTITRRRSQPGEPFVPFVGLAAIHVLQEIPVVQA